MSRYYNRIIGWFAVISVVCINVLIRFKNPSFTDTQLVMSYWPIYLMLSVVAIGGVVCVSQK